MSALSDKSHRFRMDLHDPRTTRMSSIPKEIEENKSGCFYWNCI